MKTVLEERGDTVHRGLQPAKGKESGNWELSKLCILNGMNPRQTDEHVAAIALVIS